MKIAYLHGLESKSTGPKNDLLRNHFESVYDPRIHYRENNVWEKVYNDLLDFKPDYIVGSSMGGYFGLNLGKKLNVPTLLFNPALQGRSVNPEIDDSGIHRPHNIVVFGNNDSVINPIETRENIKGNKVDIHCEDIGHRIPFEIFEKYILKIKKG